MCLTCVVHTSLFFFHRAIYLSCPAVAKISSSGWTAKPQSCLPWPNTIWKSMHSELSRACSDKLVECYRVEDNRQTHFFYEVIAQVSSLLLSSVLQKTSEELPVCWCSRLSMCHLSGHSFTGGLPWLRQKFRSKYLQFLHKRKSFICRPQSDYILQDYLEGLNNIHVYLSNDERSFANKISKNRFRNIQTIH